MVAQIETRPVGTRHIDVIADGALVGSVEVEGRRFVAKPHGALCRWFETQEAAIEHVVVTVETLTARWSRALVRALEDGLDPVEVSGMTGAFFVASGSDANRGYLVRSNGATCTCPAGLRGEVCKHAAAVRACLGLLPLPEIVVEVETIACPRCSGAGTVDTSGGYLGLPAHQRRGRCAGCGGSGRVTVPPAA